MKIPNSNLHGPPSLGNDYVSYLHGTALPDGDAVVGLVDFVNAVVGSIYVRQVTANHVQYWTKVKDGNRDDDWELTQGIIKQRVLLAEFTDSTGATGTKNLNGTIPAGAYFEKTLITNVSDFVGSAAVTVLVGQLSGTPDADRYMTGTPSVASDATVLDCGVPSGTRFHAAAITPAVTITDDSDFGDLTAGALTVALYYYGGR